MVYGLFNVSVRRNKGTDEFHQSPQSHGWHENVAGSLTKLFNSPVTLVKVGRAESSKNPASRGSGGGQACKPMVTSTSGATTQEKPYRIWKTSIFLNPAAEPLPSPRRPPLRLFQLPLSPIVSLSETVNTPSSQGRSAMSWRKHPALRDNRWTIDISNDLSFSDWRSCSSQRAPRRWRRQNTLNVVTGSATIGVATGSNRINAGIVCVTGDRYIDSPYAKVPICHGSLLVDELYPTLIARLASGKGNPRYCPERKSV